MAAKSSEAGTSSHTMSTNKSKAESLTTSVNKTPEMVHFESQFDEILQTFYAAAFTLLVYRRGLCPKEGFTVETKLGVKVPWFIHPSSVDYVKEVSEKIVFFMKKNILEGAVLHVMILKDKKPHAIQRFIFRPNGGFELKLNEPQRITALRSGELLESMVSQCANCILDIRKSEITEIECPWFSRWSVSIGIKKQFLSKCRGVGPKGPFTHDPNRVYFPWKKRTRQGKKPSIVSLPPLTLDSSTLKELDKMNRLEKMQSEENECEIKAPASPDMFASEESDSHNNDLDSSTKSKDDELNTTMLKSPDGLEHDWLTVLSSSEEDCDTDGINVDDDKDLKRLHPISSFQIISGLMMNVYRIDYPFHIDRSMILASRKAEDRLQQPEDEDLF